MTSVTFQHDNISDSELRTNTFYPCLS